MPKIILFRHAKSDWQSDADTDFDRPLNKRGHYAAPVMGAYLTRWITPRTKIICSPATRTTQTYKAASAYWPVLRYDFVSELYEASAQKLADVIDAHLEAELMVIGHNPSLEWLAHMLGAHASLGLAQFRLTTASICVFSFEEDFKNVLQHGNAKILDFKNPKELPNYSYP